MPLPLYLAMTAAEISKNSSPPSHLAYMACHFSPYSTGLSNLPTELPPKSMLIVNDRIPVQDHDPVRIRDQLEQLMDRFSTSSLLLDLQRPNEAQTRAIVKALMDLPCPVAVTEQYADGLDCPVFISLPVHTPPKQVASAWQGRDLWLEATTDQLCITLTEDGAHISQETPPQVYPFRDDTLICHYKAQVMNDQIRFHLHRDRQDLEELLSHAQELGFTCAVGLWQELTAASE